MHDETGQSVLAPHSSEDSGADADRLTVSMNVTSAAIEEVWSYFTDIDRLSVWHGRAEVFEPWAGGRIRFADAGWEPIEGVVSAIERLRLIHWVVPADRSEIVETFMTTGTEVQVCIEQRGLEPGWPTDGIAGRLRGWEESIADLLLILDHKVTAPRHMAACAHMGATTADATVGLVVTAVVAGGPADAAGLRTGDILLSFGRAPLYRRSDLGVLLRAHRSGDVAAIQYVRGKQLGQTTVRLG